MSAVGEIIVRVKSINDLFPEHVIPLDGKRLLNGDVESYIVEAATRMPRRTPLTLTVVAPVDGSFDVKDAEARIKRHFENRRKQTEEKLKETLRLGGTNLFIGFVFLMFVYFLTRLFATRMPESGLMITVRELLIILVWVALWRPADLLLYEWHPIKRSAKLFKKLEQCNVTFRNDATA